ncbi:sulfate reduction electron transfer complex DsrMKJOP subunit DsrJ [Thermodesulforhabdus norvegica]|uniref:Putative sulfite reductase-associated electron transfer protein DsrJ n=1 Tax=Thermodesulforhabdus norvegica TaxID=39841 RepID=A0A1I4TCY9_9BACT|nr:sulfate reduction electron transfer complex DsrMKJOP subunit DsrJ [Thermodesulforhabdus norvegica]SFM74546.1 putative sulfite reductase-associated electron transfer protein DsrJ [Thermodesulforhabdus norvegica]
MRIYDAKPILIGLAIFLGLSTFPFWYNGGKAATPPQPSLETPEIQKMEKKECVAARDYMRTSHMVMLNDWRTEVVRNGRRYYVTAGGATYPASLQLACMKCHSNKAQFCDTCHNYIGLKPYCWDCHLEPPQGQQVEQVAKGE